MSERFREAMCALDPESYDFPDVEKGETIAGSKQNRFGGS
jgi:hypothetical protein